jgi:hypothetical protein
LTWADAEDCIPEQAMASISNAARIARDLLRLILFSLSANGVKGKRRGSVIGDSKGFSQIEQAIALRSPFLSRKDFFEWQSAGLYV